MKRLGMKLLEAFNAWFTSAAGILHTLFMVLLIILLEKFRVIRDRDGFQLLYWLTVYSAVTQPALAYVAKQGGDREERILTHIESIVTHLGVGKE
jgi:hypothetical protein